MKIPMFIAATGVATALVVPMASGSIDRSLPWDTTGQQQSTHHQQLAKKLKSGASKTKSTGAVYIYVPAPPSSSAIQMPYVDACVSAGSYCTPQEVCDIWGASCPAPLPETSTDPQAGAPANP